MTALVAGGAGNIGSHMVLSLLVEAGSRVTPGDLRPAFGGQFRLTLRSSSEASQLGHFGWRRFFFPTVLPTQT